MEAVHPLGRLAVLLVCHEAVSHVDPADDEHLAVLADVTPHLGRQLAAACIDSARLQRAPEGSGQSATGSGDDIVQRGGVRGRDLGILASIFGAATCPMCVPAVGTRDGGLELHRCQFCSLGWAMQLAQTPFTLRDVK